MTNLFTMLNKLQKSELSFKLYHLCALIRMPPYKINTMKIFIKKKNNNNKKKKDLGLKNKFIAK